MLRIQKILNAAWYSSYILLACYVSFKVEFGIEAAENNTINSSIGINGGHHEKKNTAYNIVLEKIFDRDGIRSRSYFLILNYLLNKLFWGHITFIWGYF